MVKTGNPRIDMLRPEIRAFYQPQIKAIRERIGDYVLLNTNFAIINHFVPGETRVKLASWVTNNERERHESMLMSHKGAIFDRFRILMPKIAEAVAPARLVIRPHPSENPAAWIEATRGLDNVEVLCEGSVVPWLAGAAALVHNGCTTAVEAAVLGTPVLSYRPLRCDDVESPLLSQLGEEYGDDDALISRLSKVVANHDNSLPEAQSKLLAHYVTGIEGKLSCQNIVDAIGPVALSAGTPERSCASWFHGIACRLRQKIERTCQDFRIATPAARKRMSYRVHKFPGLTEQLVNVHIARFATVLGRFESIRARRVASDIFSIE